jgi:hypothetical protein
MGWELRGSLRTAHGAFKFLQPEFNPIDLRQLSSATGSNAKFLP